MMEAQTLLFNMRVIECFARYGISETSGGRPDRLYNAYVGGAHDSRHLDWHARDGASFSAHEIHSCFAELRGMGYYGYVKDLGLVEVDLGGGDRASERLYQIHIQRYKPRD